MLIELRDFRQFPGINVGSLNSRKVQKVLAIKFEEMRLLVDKIAFYGGWEVAA